MKTKHTKGEWKISELGDISSNYQITHICQINQTMWQERNLKEEARANAKLIAAAPELLEALKDANAFLSLNGIFTNNSELYYSITNAIKKATE